MSASLVPVSCLMASFPSPGNDELSCGACLCASSDTIVVKIAVFEEAATVLEKCDAAAEKEG